MRLISIATVALENRDYKSLEDKLTVAAEWVRIAATQGADLVVLPEMLNFYRGDGPGNPLAMTVDEAVVEDWQNHVGVLLDGARRARVAVTIPLLVRERGELANVFYLIDKSGAVAGRFQKVHPTSGELAWGVVPGTPGVIVCDEFKVGGAICFDGYFADVFDCQCDADFFVIPSLTPVGQMLNYHALRLSRAVALAYPAWSRIVDLDGRDLIAGGYRNETLRFGFGSPVIMTQFNLDRMVLYIDGNQDKMLDVQKAYGGDVAIRFDQDNSIFVLESRSLDLSIHEVARRFGLVSRRDYFAQAAVGHSPAPSKL